MAESGFQGLLEAAQAADESAITELWRRWQPRLLRYLNAVERQAADDIASETWISVGRGLRNFKGNETGFGSWLFTIARRRLTDHRRSAAYRFQSATELRSDVEMGTNDASPESGALQSLASTAAVQMITATLPPEQAEVVLLKVMAGLGTDEVAAILGKSLGAIRVLQHRGLRKLAESLEQPVKAPASEV